MRCRRLQNCWKFGITTSSCFNMFKKRKHAREFENRKNTALLTPTTKQKQIPERKNLATSQNSVPVSQRIARGAVPLHMSAVFWQVRGGFFLSFFNISASDITIFGTQPKNSLYYTGTYCTEKNKNTTCVKATK